MIPALPVRVAMCVACLGLLASWMIANIADPLGGSVRRDLLVVAVGSASLVAIERWSRRPLLARTWAPPLALFLLLFVGRCVIDVGDPEFVKSVTVATTGGVLLYLLLGVAASIAIDVLIEECRGSASRRRWGLRLWTMLLAVTLAWMAVHTWRIRESLGSGNLVLGLEGGYQRPGNLLVALVALLSFATFRFAHVGGSPSRNPAPMACLVALAIVASMLAQMLGSNIAVPVILGFAVLAPAVHIAASGWSARRGLFGLAARLAPALSMAAGVAIVAVLATLQLLSVDPGRLRITGFGSGQMSSVQSRLDLWGNFPIHFAEAPVLGDMAVHLRTTGPGTYVHSVAGMLLTHTGVAGFVLFAATVLLAVRGLLNRPAPPDSLRGRGGDGAESVFAAAALVAVVAVGALATAITWAPMWFVLGLTAPPFGFGRDRGGEFILRRLEGAA